MYEIIYRKV